MKNELETTIARGGEDIPVTVTFEISPGQNLPHYPVAPECDILRAECDGREITLTRAEEKDLAKFILDEVAAQ